MEDLKPKWRVKFGTIVDDFRYEQFSYGDDRRNWHPNFIDYMAFIVNHPNFEEMPSKKDSQGKIMWNAPSERPAGSRFHNLHELRYRWWEKKASQIGIDTEVSSNWRTETAKRINPTNESVCQICGTTINLNYVYLNRRILPYFNQLLHEENEYERKDLVNIYDSFNILEDELLRSKSGTLEQFVDGIAEEKIYDFFINNFESEDRLKRDVEIIKQEIPNIVEREPRKLSPGKTGDAPDRLDGLHSYCFACRDKEDLGRLPENLAQYNQDRRAFEYWTDGNWALTSDLANKVGRGECQFPPCNKVVDLTADHIGPLAIGFRNTTLLTGLCASHNSGMGRRLNTWKMNILLSAEKKGKDVISRHAQRLWDECKYSIENDNQAEEFSDRLRDNQHHYLLTLHKLRSHGHEDLLINFLETEYARYSYNFKGIDNSTLDFDDYTETERNITYARSLRSRMVRIAFNSLKQYSDADGRNVRDVDTGSVEDAQDELISSLSTPPQNEAFRDGIQRAFKHDSNEDIDAALKKLFKKYGYNPPIMSNRFTDLFYQYMDTIGAELASVHRRRVQ